MRVMAIPDAEADADADADAGGDGAPSSASYADVVERLFAEFDGRHSFATIVAVVHQSRTELQATVPARPFDERWEQLARARLQSTPAP